MEIADVVMNEKKTGLFVKSLGANGLIRFERDEEYDPETGEYFLSGTGVTVYVSVKDPRTIAAGKSYKVYFDVYPVGAATNSSPTTVSVTVKVQK